MFAPKPENYGGRDAAVAEIKKAYSLAAFRRMLLPDGHPVDTSLHKQHKTVSNRIAKSVLDVIYAKAGVRIKPTAGVIVDTSGVGDASVDAIRKIHSAGPRKAVALPPQDDNVSDSTAMPRTGAADNWRDESAPKERPALITPPHSASLRSLTAEPTRKRDAAVDAIKLIHAQGGTDMWGMPRS